MEKKYIAFDTGTGCLSGLIIFLIASCIGFYFLFHIENRIVGGFVVLATYSSVIWIPFKIDRKRKKKKEKERKN